MPAQTAANKENEATTRLRPLANDDYHRESDVEAQVVRLLGLPAQSLIDAARSGIRGADRIVPETVVYFVREAQRRGDDDTRWALINLLLKRSARVIAAIVTAAPVERRSDCERDALIDVIEAMTDLSATNAFWEVRFWVSLKRRVLKVVERYRRIAATELQPFENEDDNGDAEDFFERQPDERLAAPEAALEVKQALEQLPPEEYRAFMLFHYYCMPQDRIALRENVSDRTIRNRLRSAEARLSRWRDRLNQEERNG